MKRYNENQGYNWWSWIKYLWDDAFDKVEDKIFDMKNEVLATLIGMPVMPTMILTFGVLSLVMLIPHTFEWACLSLIRKVDKLTDDYEKPFVIKFIQVLLAFTTLGVVSPFLVWVSPKIIYDHIKKKQRNTVRDIQERLSEMVRQQERMADFLYNLDPEVRRQSKPDFLPKKTIKAHSLKDKKKNIFVSPGGVYVNERDYSYMTLGEFESYEDYLRRETERNLARARRQLDRERMIDPWGGDNDNYRPIEYNEEV